MDKDSTLSTSRTLPFSPQAIYQAFASADVLASFAPSAEQTRRSQLG